MKGLHKVNRTVCKSEWAYEVEIVFQVQHLLARARTSMHAHSPLTDACVHASARTLTHAHIIAGTHTRVACVCC